MVQRLVLDCSVVFGFVFEDEQNEYTLAVLEELPFRKLVVPSLFVYELSSVLHTQQKKSRWPASHIDALLLLLNSLPLTIEHFSLSETSNLWALATQESLTPYDAAYLETAKRYNIPLATQDKALKRAAQKTGLFFAR